MAKKPIFNKDLAASGLNQRIFKRSGRGLSQAIAASTVQKPLFTDNWDLVFNYDIKMLTNLVKNIPASFAPGKVSNVLDFFNGIKEAVTNINALYASTISIFKLSAKMENITLPTYELKTKKLKYGPLRFYYPIDFDYDGFSIVLREDESEPLYPFFDMLRRLQVNDDGTFNEPAVGKIDAYFTLYSDHQQFGFITWYLRGARVKKITFNEGGTFNRKDPRPFTYRVDFDIDNLRVEFNQANPLINLVANNTKVSPDSLFRNLGFG